MSAESQRQPSTPGVPGNQRVQSNGPQEPPSGGEQGEAGASGNGSPSSSRNEPRNYTVSIYSSYSSTSDDETKEHHIPRKLGEVVQKLQKNLPNDMPVWLLIQGDGKYGDLDEDVRRAFFKARRHMEKGKKIALLIDSLGGEAKRAYQLAMLFRTYCDGFVAVVPRRAKSAATLLTLGASIK